MEFKDITLSATFTMESTDHNSFDAKRCNRIVNDAIDSALAHIGDMEVSTKTVTIIGNLKKFSPEDRVEIHNMLCDIDDLTMIRSVDECHGTTHEFRAKDVTANFYRRGIIVILNLIFLD